MQQMHLKLGTNYYLYKAQTEVTKDISLRMIIIKRMLNGALSFKPKNIIKMKFEWLHIKTNYKV